MIVPNKSAIHRIDVPTARNGQDVVTAAGVNKFIAGVNSEALNGLPLVKLTNRVLPNDLVTGSGPGPTIEQFPHPVCGQIQDGPTTIPTAATQLDCQFMLPDTLNMLYCTVDVSWTRPEGYLRLFIRSFQGAIWQFAEITPDRVQSNLLGYGPGFISTSAIETGIGRHQLKIEMPISGIVLPPAGFEESRYLQIVYDHRRPTVEDTQTFVGVPAGLWNLQLYAFRQ
jgi:hypothetical protein